MDDFSWFGPALFALIAIAWWTHPLSPTEKLTKGEVWWRRLARVAMFLLYLVLISSAGDFRKMVEPRGGDPDGGVEIPYSF